MGLNDLNFDFDINKIIEDIRDIIFKTVRVMFNMVFGLPTWIKITLAVLLVLSAIGIAFLTWKYRDQWRYVKY
ncbi:hypothetical protein LCGC14_0548280 [marine sediment metagenome]|uniref:Uncharacterized protein n=1 Tax=marine sediment metagenome TaxID=412755 RepID=A0A0F9S9A5_9ZZZZ